MARSPWAGRRRTASSGFPGSGPGDRPPLSLAASRLCACWQRTGLVGGAVLWDRADDIDVAHELAGGHLDRVLGGAAHLRAVGPHERAVSDQTVGARRQHEAEP